MGTFTQGNFHSEIKKGAVTKEYSHIHIGKFTKGNPDKQIHT
jgi:hypothetical protein